LLFLNDINEDCQKFQADWNAHPVTGSRTNNKSPVVSCTIGYVHKQVQTIIQDLRFLGQVEHGIYEEDPMANIHPDTINRYYGVDSIEQTRSDGQTGAGHPDDEDIDSETGDTDVEDGSEGDESDGDHQWTALQCQIASDQAHNIRHKPVKVARHHNPFATPEAETEFRDILALVVESRTIPGGYGVLVDEWEDGYPEREIIKTGLRGKGLEVVLPEEVWFPRAVLWTQALDVMTQLVEIDGDD
jgi:hypothetical protein